MVESNAMNDMLKELAAMTNEALKKEWEQWVGQPAPKSTSKDHFIRVTAWHRQAQKQGGLSAGLKRRLRQLAEDLESGKATRLLNPPPKMKPGTMIIKTWQEVEYRVMALEDGFAFEGKTWKSLSMIAREITGTRWNGPAFFGLRQAAS